MGVTASACRLLVCAAGCALACLAAARVATAAIPTSARYDVQLQGDVNGIPFARAGALAIGPSVTAVTTNGVNPVDLCLGSGSPFISPEPGAIWFATNGVCVNANGARQDMAFVTADAAAGTIAIRPDPNISATGVNGFNQNGGLTANVYQVFDGAIALQFPGNGATVTGSIDILGTGAIFHSEQRYRATLTGTARELTPAPAPPAGDVEPRIDAVTRRQRVGRRRIARVGTLVCTTGPCTVTAPKSVGVKIAGTPSTATVVVARTIASGKRAPVRVKLSRNAFKRLAGRTAVVKLGLSVAAGGRQVQGTLRATIVRPG